MRIIWLPAARRSRASQIAYIAERNPQAALTMANAIRFATDQLADHLYIGRPGRVAGTRELVVGRTPYVVIYEVRAGRIRILRVLHSAQQWPPIH